MPDLAISPCHTPQHPIYTHIHKRRDTMDKLDSRRILDALTATIGFIGMATLAVLALYL